MHSHSVKARQLWAMRHSQHLSLPDWTFKIDKPIHQSIWSETHSSDDNVIMKVSPTNAMATHSNIPNKNKMIILILMIIAFVWELISIISDLNQKHR